MNFSVLPSASVGLSVARTKTTGGTVRTSKKRISLACIFCYMNTELFFELMLNIHEAVIFPIFCSCEKP